MPTLNLWFRLVGVEPSRWVELSAGVQPASPPVFGPGLGGGLFMQQLPERVWIPMAETLKYTKAFDAVNLAGAPSSAAQISRTDLLCYVCQTRDRSIVGRNNPQRLRDFLQTNPDAGGMTANLPTPPIGEAIVSEIWLDRQKNDMGMAWRAVYHEFMHNKTRWGSEDPEWVHRTGGHGVADQNGPANYADVNKTNMMLMAQHLSNANTQFWQTML